MNNALPAGSGGSRYWLMNFFGQVLDHDPLHDRLVTSPLSLRGYPGIFFYAEDIETLPYEVALRKAVSLPMPLPQLKAVLAGVPDLIALAIDAPDEDGEVRYLTSADDGNFRYDAREIAGWERFLPLSEALLHALVILSQPTLSTLRDDAGAPLAELTCERFHHARIGDFTLPLSSNMVAIEEVAGLPPGMEHRLTLTAESGERSIIVTRK